MEKWLQSHPTEEQVCRQFKISIQQLIFQFSDRYARELERNAVDDAPKNVFSSIVGMSPNEAWKRFCDEVESDPNGLAKAVLLKMAISKAPSPIIGEQPQETRPQRADRM